VLSVARATQAFTNEELAIVLRFLAELALDSA
jgi:hypothetical protein